MNLKYWSKVRVTSWFYEGKNWYIVREVNNEWFYKVAVWFVVKKRMIDEHKTYIHESSLELIK